MDPYQYQMPQSPDIAWDDWVNTDMMDQDYPSSHSAGFVDPTSSLAFTEIGTSCFEPMSYTPYLNPPSPGVSDNPGLISGSAPSSVGSPRSPRSPRSDSPESSPERELPHTMSGLDNTSPMWYFDGSGTDPAAFDTSSAGYAVADVQTSYNPILNGYPQRYQTSTSSSDSDPPSPNSHNSSSHYSTTPSPPHSPPQSSNASSASHHSRSSRGSHKRATRTIHDVEKINLVREAGGCIVCRMGKYSCDLGRDACQKCHKVGGGHARSCCIRQLPSEIIGTEQLWGSSSLRVPREAQAPQQVYIFLSGDGERFQSSALPVMVQRVSSLNDFCLFQEHGLTELHLTRWAETQIASEYQMASQTRTQLSYHGLMERLVMEYTNSRHTSSRRLLVGKVHTLNCMFRIWKSHMITPDHQPLSATVHIQLQNIAREFIKTAQRDIMKEFDRSIKDIKSKDRDLPLWACLWLTIFIYQSLLEYQPGMVESGLASSSITDRTERLVVALMLLLSMHFRNQSPFIMLQTSESDAKRSCGGDSRVLGALKEVAEARADFHNYIGECCRRNMPWSTYWKQLIVDTEKDLDRRRKRSKGSSK